MQILWCHTDKFILQQKSTVQNGTTRAVEIKENKCETALSFLKFLGMAHAFCLWGDVNFRNFHFRLKQWGKEQKINDSKISNTEQFKHCLFKL